MARGNCNLLVNFDTYLVTYTSNLRNADSGLIYFQSLRSYTSNLRKADSGLIYFQNLRSLVIEVLKSINKLNP